MSFHHLTILTIPKSKLCIFSQERVRGMPRALKRSRRTSSAQSLKSSPKKSLRSWRFVRKKNAAGISLIFFFTGGEGGWPYERRTVTFAVNYADKTFFIKRS